MGIELRELTGGVEVRGRDPRGLRPVRVETKPYPGFPTDLHPPLAALLSLVPGESRIREGVFEDRFAYAEGLSALGARVRTQGREAIIEGVPQLKGTEVKVERDNRAGAALVLAALAAEGESLVRDEEEQIPRGYSRLAETLRELGADIREENPIATRNREEGE
jgi:UDP-N-acetylglucosamine 1-carboxyvinyltransferase